MLPASSLHARNFQSHGTVISAENRWAALRRSMKSFKFSRQSATDRYMRIWGFGRNSIEGDLRMRTPARPGAAHCWFYCWSPRVRRIPFDTKMEGIDGTPLSDAIWQRYVLRTIGLLVRQRQRRLVCSEAGPAEQQDREGRGKKEGAKGGGSGGRWCGGVEVSLKLAAIVGGTS